jgi:Tol biopolymer transport system component
MRRSAVGVLVVSAVVALAGCGGSSAKPRPDLLFVSTRSGVYDIYEMNSDGGLQRRVTSGNSGNASTPSGLYYEFDPAWSPDGKSIAFASRRNGISNIYIMDASGRNVSQLTTAGTDDVHPSFSPDGKEIAFESGLRVWVMKADGTGAHRITHDTAAERDPAWSPDGRWIAYSRGISDASVREIWLVHPDGTGGHTLTSLNGSASGPAWSPNGKQIAFSDDARVAGPRLWEIGVNGKGARRLTTSSSAEIDPAWSPQGTTIAFSSDGSIVVTPVGSAVETTLTDSKNNDSSPAWNPVLPKASGY